MAKHGNNKTITMKPHLLRAIKRLPRYGPLKKFPIEHFDDVTACDEIISEFVSRLIFPPYPVLLDPQSLLLVSGSKMFVS